jgi:hypothetical protein
MSPAHSYAYSIHRNACINKKFLIFRELHPPNLQNVRNGTRDLDRLFISHSCSQSGLKFLVHLERTHSPGRLLHPRMLSTGRLGSVSYRDPPSRRFILDKPLNPINLARRGIGCSDRFPYSLYLGARRLQNRTMLIDGSKHV